MIFALAIAVLLGQADTHEHDPAAAEPPPAGAPTMPPAPPAAMPRQQMTPEQMAREAERIKNMLPEEAVKAAAELERRLSKGGGPDGMSRARLAGEAVIPEVKDYSKLPEEEQVKYSAREFFTQLIAGDARNITNNCALPFQLEERKLQTADELFGEWLRNLRAKRTDLLTLYDIEVLAPADMEKKYGKPPARLQNLPWRGAKTYVAVANLSGHAAIAVFRHTGVNWAVVGYAD